MGFDSAALRAVTPPGLRLLRFVSSVPNELIFVVDRSGSMGGTSIEEVRNALQLCLRSMIAGCRFNIVGFGSTFQLLFPERQVYDERSLTAASTHVVNLQADLGGTELLPALQFVLDLPCHAGVRASGKRAAGACPAARRCGTMCPPVSVPA